MEIIYQRVAGIDVGKQEIAVPSGPPGTAPGAARVEVTRKFKTRDTTLDQCATFG